MPEIEAAQAAEQAPAEDIATQAEREVKEALSRDPQHVTAQEAIKAVEEVLGDDGKAKTDAPVVPPKAEDKDAQFQEAKSKVAAALKERNKVFQDRQSARQEAEAIKAEASRALQEAQAFAAQVKAQAAQMQQWQQTLRTDPAQALRQAGMDPEEFVFGLAKGDTAEGKLAKQLREQQKQIDEFNAWKKSQAEHGERQQREWQEKQAQAFRGKIENDFMAMATSDKYANVKRAIDAGLVSKNALIAEGDTIADQYREATGGAEASVEEILDYIDSQVSQAITKLGSKQALPPNPGKPPQAQVAQVQKQIGPTLSQEDAGERRTLHRESQTEDAEERKENARQAVRAVLKRTGTK